MQSFFASILFGWSGLENRGLDKNFGLFFEGSIRMYLMGNKLAAERTGDGKSLERRGCNGKRKGRGAVIF
jgi:hypothetical protein